VATITAEKTGRRSDAELLAAHAAGDPLAFPELFRRYHRQLIRVAGLRSRTAEDAADAVQEALLAVHRTASTFRQHCTVSTWLHRIVINKCTDQLRRDRVRGTVHTTGAPHPTTAGADAGVLTSVMVHRALAALSTEQRAAVTAVDLQGYSVADAARLLGIAEGTVKSRCARGRARLAVLLGGEPVW